MTATKIMLIGHAEKPSDDGKVVGVTAAGAADAEQLVVHGWQRSGAFVRFSHRAMASFPTRDWRNRAPFSRRPPANIARA